MWVEYSGSSPQWWFVASRVRGRDVTSRVTLEASSRGTTREMGRVLAGHFNYKDVLYTNTNLWGIVSSCWRQFVHCICICIISSSFFQSWSLRKREGIHLEHFELVAPNKVCLFILILIII